MQILALMWLRHIIVQLAALGQMLLIGRYPRDPVDVWGMHAHMPLIGRLEGDGNDIRRCLCAHLPGPPPVYLLGKPAVSFISKHHLRLADCWTYERERATPTDKDPYQRYPVYR